MSVSAPPMVFSTLIEGAHRAFGARLTPELRARVRAHGLDLDATRAAYPVNEFLPGFLALAEEVVPGEAASREARLREFGLQFMNGFARTALGSAIFTMSRVIGTRRAMERIGRNVRSIGNFLDATCEVRAPNEVVITTRVLPRYHSHVTPLWSAMAFYRLGIFDSILFNLKAREPFAELVDQQPHTTTFRARWAD